MNDQEDKIMSTFPQLVTTSFQQHGLVRNNPCMNSLKVMQNQPARDPAELQPQCAPQALQERDTL